MSLEDGKLDDGIKYTFPAGTTIAAGGYRVVAKNVARLATVYPGPHGGARALLGQLSNSGETSSSKTARAGGGFGQLLGFLSLGRSRRMRLGAGPDFHGINRYQYQYKGRSLERVSVAGGENDAANWLASPLPAGPSPGAANHSVRAVPKPVVVRIPCSKLRMMHR